jgi:hypothetical protein
MTNDLPRESGQGGGPSRGIGFGLFLLVAGGVLLAQQFGLVPKSIDWFFPLVLLAWGASELYQRLK